MADSYNTLRMSGDMVGGAVQQILSVQGSLDDLKEDLGTEYRRWKNKQTQLLSKRDSLVADIKAQEAELLNQESLKLLSVRLDGDLKLATEETAKLNETRDTTAEARQQEQARLHVEISTLLSEIEAMDLKRQLTLNATQQRIDAVLLHQRMTQLDILNLTNNISDVQALRARHEKITSQEHGRILQEIAYVRKQTGLVQTELEEQAQVQLERDHLADQATEVVKQREKLDQHKVNCTASIQQIDMDLAATQKSMEDDTVEMRRCQDMDGENQNLKSEINKCAAASLAANR